MTGGDPDGTQLITMFGLVPVPEAPVAVTVNVSEPLVVPKRLPVVVVITPELLIAKPPSVLPAVIAQDVGDPVAESVPTVTLFPIGVWNEKEALAMTGGGEPVGIPWAGHACAYDHAPSISRPQITSSLPASFSIYGGDRMEL